MEDLLNNVDGCENSVMTYEDINMDDIDCILEPAPYVSDKITQEKREIWNEFLRLVGVANLSIDKKERNIRDEIQASQGGTIVSRFNRYEPRKSAIKQIKEKFNIDLSLKYYDGEPTNKEEDGDNYVISDITNVE